MSFTITNVREEMDVRRGSGTVLKYDLLDASGVKLAECVTPHTSQLGLFLFESIENNQPTVGTTPVPTFSHQQTGEFNG
jgi:hypothetical protein